MTAVVVSIGLVLRLEGEAPATAAELLRRTAVVAADQQPSPEDGPYLYTMVQTDQLLTSSEGGRPWSVLLPTTEETWIGVDGSGRIVTTIGRARFLGERDRQRWLRAGSPELPTGRSDDVFPPGSLPHEDLSTLPTDPGRLLGVLRDQVADEDLPRDVAVFVRVGELLASADATPELRAALYRVASDLPGVELLGEALDPLARDGVAVGMSYDDAGAAMRAAVVFDEETSTLLAQVQVLLEPVPWIDAEPGTRITYVAYLEVGRAPTVRAVP